MADSVLLPPREMRGLMHGDRAPVRVSRDSSNRWLGELQEITGRGVNAFLGTMEIHGKKRVGHTRPIVACSSAAPSLSRISMAHAMAIGSSRAFRVTRQGGSAAQARIEKRLDPDRPVELSTESAIARFELPHEFSAAALREAAAFGDRVDPAEVENRVDLRNTPLVTIDGDNAKDFDDAVYAEPHAQGFRLLVAIADVESLRAAGNRVGRRRRRAWHIGLFPDARRPDASARTVGSSVLARAES